MPVQPGCLFCTEEPCASHVGKPKKNSTRKPRGSEASASTPSPTTPIETNTSDEWMDAPKQTRFEKRVADQPELSQDELMLREAIRNLWPILSTAEKNRQRDLVDPPRTALQVKRKAEVRRMLDGPVE